MTDTTRAGDAGVTSQVGIGARIVVAEDDAIVRQDLMETLAGLGYDVVGGAGTGAEALRLARDERPDLVVMDIRMPGRLTGIDAAETIGEDLDVPVVFLTAYSDDLTVGRAKRTHPFGYLLKPVDDRELKSTVEIALYRHHMERLLRRSEERYRALFEADLAGHFVMTPGGRVLDCNAAFGRLLGFPSPEACMQRNAESFFAEPGARGAIVEQLRGGDQVRNRKLTLLRADGRPVRVLANVARAADDDGVLREIHGHVVDITREEELQEELRRTARMEAVARLAGGVAHDFNNLLTAIRGTAELVLTEVGSNERAGDDLKEVLALCDRATTIVRELLAVGGRSGRDDDSRTGDLAAILREQEKILRRLLDDRIELDVQVPDEPLPVRVSPVRLEQVILNLALNARDALGQGGSIVLEARWVEGREPEDRAPPLRRPGGGPPDDGSRVRLSVADSGLGMDESVRERIFDPYFTTKEEGTGLGLASVYGIVREAGGSIDVHSEPGEGTTFVVELPGARGGLELVPL